MRCLIVDDEELARERLSRLVQELDGYIVAGEAPDGVSALRQIEALQPDIVLLDIRMPGMDGLEVASHLASFDKPPAVIFTTAYGDHALEAFEAQAVDYLLKPIRADRLQIALQKARRLGAGDLERFQDSEAGRPRTHICARSRGNLQLIPVREVLYFQADSKYVTVRSARQQALIEESLKALEQEFADSFIRIHRNSLVAADAVRCLEKNSAGQHSVVLEEIDERLEVSRRLLPEVRRRFKAGAKSGH